MSPANNSAKSALVYDANHFANPLGDANQVKDQPKKNHARVGTLRPSNLLYTYGPGAIVDLAHFSVMPLGYDDWDRAWHESGVTPPQIHAPRLLTAVQRLLKNPAVRQLRPFPQAPGLGSGAREADSLGIPARVFPQWMRCTGCDQLARLGHWKDGYANRKAFQPHEAGFLHQGCHGRSGAQEGHPARVIPARYLLACEDGHLDEFPYDWWVHRQTGGVCPRCRNGGSPQLYMHETGAGSGSTSMIECRTCGAWQPMAAAQGPAARDRLPRCRGRYPHLDAFVEGGCDKQPRLMLVGASNLWFPAVQSIIDMPLLDPQSQLEDQAARLRELLSPAFDQVANQPDAARRLPMVRMALTVQPDPVRYGDLAALDDDALRAVIDFAQSPEPSERPLGDKGSWDPISLLVPEWNYLDQVKPAHERFEEGKSGLTVSPRQLSPLMPAGIERVLAVDKLRKVNAIVGFTRIDGFDRISDLGDRLVPLTRSAATQTWTAGTEDRGEGIFIQLDERRVAAWEARVRASELWKRLAEAHGRYFRNRFSETATLVDPADRLPGPRYWLVHTFAHVLMRRMALSSGYGAASLSERLYAWEGTGPNSGDFEQGSSQGDNRPAAAGLLICTTASDSDGTLGGLVALSQPDVLARTVHDALQDARRCPSDPLCAQRVPQDPEDFLHGAACHSCAMAPETSCERGNQFLDRRFLVPLPGEWRDLAFFQDDQSGSLM